MHSCLWPGLINFRMYLHFLLALSIITHHKSFFSSSRRITFRQRQTTKLIIINLHCEHLEASDSRFSPPEIVTYYITCTVGFLYYSTSVCSVGCWLPLRRDRPVSETTGTSPLSFNRPRTPRMNHIWKKKGRVEW